jgi:hypothetical protein
MRFRHANSIQLSRKRFKQPNFAPLLEVNHCSFHRAADRVIFPDLRSAIFQQRYLLREISDRSDTPHEMRSSSQVQDRGYDGEDHGSDDKFGGLRHLALTVSQGRHREAYPRR